MAEKHAEPAKVPATRLVRLARAYRAAQEGVVTAREALAGAIHEAEAAGSSLHQIARDAGMPTATVHRLLTAEAARLQLVHVEDR